MALAAAAPLAVCVALAAVPYWWHDPIEGLLALVRASTSRESHTSIAGLLWGETYFFHAPWTQPFTMIAVGTPLTLRCPGGAGVARAVAGRCRDPHLSMCLAAAAVPLGATLLPQAPNHDGLRLLLPFLASLAAVELAEWGRCASRPAGVLSTARRRWASLGAVTALAAQASASWVYHPYQLSYYNALAGARERGLEVSC